MDILFSEWLQEELKRRNWSQADMARASGLSRQAISKYINQERTMPDKKAVEAIAHALGYPPETILRAAGMLPHIDEEDAELEKWKARLALLPPEKRELLWRIMEAMDLDSQYQEEEHITTARSRKQKGAISGNAT